MAKLVGNEVELRRMLEHAEGHEPDIVEGRFVIAARHGGRPWDVIAEPEADRRLLVPGLVIDYAIDGSATGIEITAPARLSLSTLNAVLADVGHAPASEADLAPLAAA